MLPWWAFDNSGSIASKRRPNESQEPKVQAQIGKSRLRRQPMVADYDRKVKNRFCTPLGALTLVFYARVVSGARESGKNRLDLCEQTLCSVTWSNVKRAGPDKSAAVFEGKRRLVNKTALCAALVAATAAAVDEWLWGGSLRVTTPCRECMAV